MTRREFAKKAASAELLARPFSILKARTNTPPNIVLILTDDQGYGDLGCHGNDKIRTPNLDRLAGESVEFSHFYVSPVCSPTRSSLMTGRYHYRTGVLHTSRGAAKMHANEVTVAEILGKAGYATGIFGKWHLGDNYPLRPMDHGFQETLVHKDGGLCQAPDLPGSYFDPKLYQNGKAGVFPGYCTDVFTNAATEFIEKNRKSPFFVYLPTNAPHDPLYVAKEYSEPYAKMGLGERVSKVYGMVTNIDDNAGRLLRKLRELRLEENTIVLFMTDNGPAGDRRYNAGMRGIKGSVHDGGIRVPCFMRWPGHFEPGRKIDRVAAHIDILPTLVEACGLRASEGHRLDGRSLMPLLRSGRADWSDRMLFFQFNRGMTPVLYQNCAVRSQRYKGVAHAGMFDEQDSKSPAPGPDFELYDMTKDPAETRDLAKEIPDVTSRMRRAYETWFEEIRSSGGFTPGVIHIGSDRENPSHICRYQDASYVHGVPQGWPVTIERSGRYEITINRGEYRGKGRLCLKFGDYFETKPLAEGENRAVFDCPAGTGMLDVWSEEEGKARTVFTKNDIVGDFDMKRLN